VRDTRIHIAGSLSPGRRIALPAQAAQHVTRVLRLREGAELTVFDGAGGQYRSTLQMSARGEATVEIHEHSELERESPLRITLLQGVARGERMDWIVQKSTELGVTAIWPVATARSVVQLDADRSDKRLQHWEAVAASACEQSGRNTLPQIAGPRDFAAAMREAASIPCRLLLEPRGGEALQTALGATPPAGIALLVGPEGGLDETEVELAHQAGFRPVRLGPRVLRTETAGPAALAALQCLAGDFR